MRALITELFPGNKFYAQKLNSLGLTFDVASLKDFTLRFPFTTKSELVQDQQQHPPFGINLTYPLDRYTRFHQTSGTTGAPLRWLDTPESWDGMVESWTKIFQAAGIDGGDRVYFAFSFGPFIGFWLAFESAARLGCLCVPGGGASSAARIRAIQDNGITAVCCTPTYALRLAEAATEAGIDSGKLKVRTLIVAGEPGGSIVAVRERISQMWGRARVFDHHGMTETGPVTYECPAQPGVLHVLESAYLAEVIEPASGKPVKAGETGELVLTTLGRIGMPLLRYRTGDLAKPRVVLQSGKGAVIERCACGSSELALEGGIIGRTDEMVTVRGVNIFPSAIEAIVCKWEGISEYQVEFNKRTTLPELNVRIETVLEGAEAIGLAKQLERNFDIALGLRIPVIAVPRGTLPKFELKAKRWVTRS